MKFKCADCNASLEVRENDAGKRGKCPKCGAVIEIPVIPVGTVETSRPPATEKQKDYARTLGINFPTNITNREISTLINKAVEQREEERFKKLDDLSNRESRAYEEMRAEVLAHIDEEDCRLSKATLSQMVEELDNRGKGAILVSFPIDDVDFENIIGTEFSISFSDNLSEDEMRTILLNMGVEISRQGFPFPKKQNS